MDYPIEQIKEKLTRPISLIGMMGVGKSHFSSRLCKKLGVMGYDMDNLIEEDQKDSISNIFAKHGESYFRTLETQKLAELITLPPAIISTGGGVVVTPVNLKAITHYTHSIWIKSGVDDIMARLQNNKSRPLLQTENPRATVENFLASREALYAQADIHIENDGKNDVMAQIIDALSKAV